MPKNAVKKEEVKKEAVKMTVTVTGRDKLDQALLEKMREAGLKDTQFVALANVVGCRPQLIYSKRNQKTGEYYYGRIADFIEEQYTFHHAGEQKTADEIVDMAAAVLQAKEDNKRGKQQEAEIDRAKRYLDKLTKIMQKLDEEQQIEIRTILADL